VARDFATIGVVGLGTMGAGIAEVFARNGIDVIGVEATDDALERGRGHVDHSTGRALRRGKLTEAEQQAIYDHISYTTSLDDLAAAQLVIEAIPERLELKKELFSRLDAICPPDTVLATNTSSLSVTEIAVATQRPSKVLGVHFFNPAPVMNLVEIISTVVTDSAVVEDVEVLMARIGKTDVTAGDKAGFIANALLFGYLNNAVHMLESRFATREHIDAAMKLGCGHPMGPLGLLDLIGLDSAYEILDTMYHESRDHLHAPAPILKQLVTAGFLGRKTGRGFYTYERPNSPVMADAAPPVAEDRLDDARALRRIGVVGTGTMATGIVEVCAEAGYDVVLRGRGDDRTAALARVSATTSLGDLADCDLVIEAGVEESLGKQELFAELDRILKPGAVLATTSSSLPVIECAAATARPADVVGLHFFDPAPVMKLVEIVPTVRTADDVVATAKALVLSLGKYPVVCGDRAGFIVNALLFPYLNDAVKMVEANYATADDIDSAMKLGCGHPMGPFELMDVVGLDVTLTIQQRLYLEFREPGFAPARMLGHLVKAGYLGRKTGRGFRDYTER
jgi:3-hydroxybutyryl-CoA dehydrogenase